ncbi:MAG: hydrolase [Azorhizobium sp. 32-67-21]|nr:MAG: hydrolase [Azorhizobium sp. 32-67-21]
MKRFRKTTGLSRLAAGVAAATVFAASLGPALSCTRAMYVADNGLVITGRTMDWAEDMHTNLWAFPRGISRDGAGGANTPKWTSRYGSVIASGYDVGSADGMNEAGLVANLLYLAESDYGQPDGKPAISISLWAQYVLDNFGSVAEAVEALSKETFRVIAPKLPNGQGAQLHLSISDSTGDSAIFEYLGGKLVVHHGKKFNVMTNSPSFDQQLALDSYWEGIGGLTFLPGTNRAADRFARASFLIKAIPTKVDPSYISAVPDRKFEYQAAASVLGVMRGVSVPLGITTPNQPNISSTLWRTISDQTNKIYFFDSSTSPNSFWVPLADLDLKQGAPVKKLTLEGGKVYSGNAADRFVATPAFRFLPSTGM